MQSHTEHADTLKQDDPEDLRLLKLVSLLMTVAAALLAPYLYIASPQPLEAMAALAGAVLGWLIYAAARKGQRHKTALLLNISVFAMAVIATLAFGSTRNAGNFLFLGGVVSAGIFFSRRALLTVVLLSVVTMGLLTLAEVLGWLRTPDMRVGIKTWIVQSVCLVVVALLVYRNRLHVESAARHLREELALRKRTEEQRDRSLDRFVRIFRNSPSPMLAQSARDGMILDVNPAFERCYGYTREQVLGRPDNMLWADQSQRVSYLEQLGERRRTDRVAARSLRADGSRFDALVSSELSDDPGDRLVITSVVDVSEQNEAMARLRRSEERFAQAFHFSPLNMSITRLSDGQVIEVNRADELTAGNEPQALYGRTTQDIGLWQTADERAAFVAQLERDGHVHAYETQMRHRDGHLLDVRIWAEKIDIDGEACVLSCAIDTSAEKRREAQLMALSRGMAGPSGDALFQALSLHMAQAIGADMVTVGELQSDGLVRTLAVWRDGASASNHSYPPADGPCHVTLEKPGLHIIPAGLTQRFPNLPNAVGTGFEAYAGQALHDADGSPIGLLTAFWRQPGDLPNDARALLAIFASRANAELVRLRRDREIQHLNRSLEQRVRERTAELQKLNAELDSFAYSVSHDLKSPLRAIDGFAQLLQESLGGRLTAKEHEQFERILAATHRMDKLIADLLALAHISQGVLQWQTVDLSALCEDILTSEQTLLPSRRLHWQVAPGLRTEADERLARIALENLLRNAVKYTRDRKDARIEVGQLPGTRGMPGAFYVRDNGTGFDMAYAHRLFQPFQRLHMPSAGFDGTGIGLATVRRIVERHGGNIRAEAAPDQGACFTFSFGPAPVSAQPTTAPQTGITS